MGQSLRPVRPGLRQIVAQATARRKEDRFQDVTSLLEAVSVYEEILTSGGAATPARKTPDSATRLKLYLTSPRYNSRLHDLVMGELRKTEGDLTNLREAVRGSTSYSETAAIIPRYDKASGISSDS